MRRVLSLAALSLVAACQTEAPPGQNYFDRVIEPILIQSCARNTGGCHQVDQTDTFGFAAGNLDVTSFDNIHKRPDVLRTFGTYPVPFLLLKAAGETDMNNPLTIGYPRAKSLYSIIPHSGGKVLTVSSTAFITLQTWLENGATMDGVRPDPTPVVGQGACQDTVPDDFDETTVTGSAQWSSFAGEFDAVQAVLTKETCNARNCHGALQSDFYLTCGTGQHEKAWNFRQVWAFSTTTPNVDTSEVLRRPVAHGAPHTGGAHFADQTDPEYVTIAHFAMDVGEYDPPMDPQETFFADKVMPIFLERGCGSEGCHSPAAMNDFKLRAGTQGFFSRVALDKNYELTKENFMAFEVPDVRRSRAVAKNILPANGGISHRGGPLLELQGGAATTVTCPASANPCDDTYTASPFCTIQQWSICERSAMAPANPNAGTVKVVYVKRPAASTGPSLLDFTNFEGGAELHVTGMTAAGGPDGSDTQLCATAGADIRSPDVMNDGQTVVFAMRKNAGDTLHLYTVGIGGGGCTQLTTGGDYDFDPVFSPDGLWVVFASSRRPGAAPTKRLNLPQSDIWRIRLADGFTEEMTFLSNSEIGPHFMREGRVTMTTEKVDVRDPQNGFYQLSGRRINWDLTDYHPLLGQRSQSPVDPANPMMMLPSIGFGQVTEIREGLDGNFVMIGSDPGAVAMGGTLVMFNRSVGPFEADRTDPGFLASVTERPPPSGGLFRSPVLLPSGKILVAQASSGTSFDLVTVPPPSQGITAAPATFVGCGGAACLEPAVALVYPARPLYDNRRQLVFGGHGLDADASHAVVHFPDFPMVATLLGANLRRGRDVVDFRSADHVTVLDGNGNNVGSAPLASDGSVRFRAPASTPLYLTLTKGGSTLFQMTEEHQFGPGENISIGVPEAMFDHVCAGCHGSVSGKETDVGVSADALTSASISLSIDASPTTVGP